MKHKIDLGETHPTVWKSIKTIQYSQSEVSTKIAQAVLGAPPAKKINRKYQRLQERLRNLAIGYATGGINVGDYLRRVGLNIQLERS